MTAASSFFARYWPVLFSLLGAAAALFPWLGLPAGFASVVGLVALRKPSEAELPRVRWWLAAGALLSSVGLVRFLVVDAMPGIVGGGRTAVEQEAVSRLRDVLFAEDAMRRAGWIDPDSDGIGSAAFLEELCGGAPLRGQAPRPTPVLHCGELVPTPLGPAARNGAYLYTLCLPTPGADWTARGGTPIDEEAAERRFLAFAWPISPSPFESAFLLDEHEAIRVALLPEQAPGVRHFPASCAAALGTLEWRVWRNKQPRATLPGDTLPSDAASGDKTPGENPAGGENH